MAFAQIGDNWGKLPNEIFNGSIIVIILGGRYMLKILIGVISDSPLISISWPSHNRDLLNCFLTVAEKLQWT